MDTQAKLAVQQTIVRGFASTPHPGNAPICSSSERRVQLDPELEQFVNDFRGKHWARLQPEIVREHASDLPFFTIQAFRFFLPAFMLLALDEYESDHTLVDYITMTLDSLLSQPSSQDRKVLEVFSTEEAHAIKGFLRFIHEHTNETVIRSRVAAVMSKFE